MIDWVFKKPVPLHRYFEKHCVIAFISFYLALWLIYISTLPTSYLSCLPFLSAKADITVFWGIHTQLVILREMGLRFCSLTFKWPFEYSLWKTKGNFTLFPPIIFTVGQYPHHKGKNRFLTFTLWLILSRLSWLIERKTPANIWTIILQWNMISLYLQTKQGQGHCGYRLINGLSTKASVLVFQPLFFLRSLFR